MDSPDTRKSLLFRLSESSQDESWAEFVAIYEPLIYRVARAKGLQHADAEDIVQEVFASVEKAIDRFDSDKGSFRGWLCRITRNLTINFLTRDKSVRGTGDTECHSLLQQQAMVEEETLTMFQLEHRREVFQWTAKRVRKHFREDTWQAFWLTGVNNLSIEEAAKKLEKTPGAIRIARCRVLDRFQKEVAKFDGEYPT